MLSDIIGNTDLHEKQGIINARNKFTFRVTDFVLTIKTASPSHFLCFRVDRLHQTTEKYLWTKKFCEN